MKQGTIIQAYKTILKLSGEPLPIRTAHDLYKLRKQLEPQWGFQQEQEMTIINSLGAEVTETGQINFKSIDDRITFAKKIQELLDMDLEVTFDKISIKMEDFNVKITPNEFESLVDFIDFV